MYTKAKTSAIIFNHETTLKKGACTRKKYSTWIINDFVEQCISLGLPPSELL